MATFDGWFTYEITDINGDTANMRITAPTVDTTTVAGLKTASDSLGALIAALTNGKVTATGYGLLFLRAQISTATAPPPSNATYPSVTDGARLTFTNSNGGQRVVVVPAVKLDAFVTGTNTVNPDQSDVAALIADIESLTDLDGATNLFSGGVKVGKHARRRVSRKVL